MLLWLLGHHGSIELNFAIEQLLWLATHRLLSLMMRNLLVVACCLDGSVYRCCALVNLILVDPIGRLNDI